VGGGGDGGGGGRFGGAGELRETRQVRKMQRLLGKIEDVKRRKNLRASSFSASNFHTHLSPDSAKFVVPPPGKTNLVSGENGDVERVGGGRSQGCGGSGVGVVGSDSFSRDDWRVWPRIKL
jgi:hypothetical protein